MTKMTNRPNLEITAESYADLGFMRGKSLQKTLRLAAEKYKSLFTAKGISNAAITEGIENIADTLHAWRPLCLEELRGIARGAELPLADVLMLNARTELIALAAPSPECSAVTGVIAGQQVGAQTWDWHIELDDYWHTHHVTGPGYAFAGLTEQGIVSKIGLNSAGLALHFNILSHSEDKPAGVPMHVLSRVVLSECDSVSAALDLLATAPITSSSAFTLLDAKQAVTVDISPVGIFPLPNNAGSAIRTNHFLHDCTARGQKTPPSEFDSAARFALLEKRLSAGSPHSVEDLLTLLESAPGEAPLSCVADLSKDFGERFATLATVLSEPAAKRISVLEGMPKERATTPWREFKL